ncbi:UDP-galactopyranose mutase [Sulfobacillus thermosulfidooxidans DSM 9293]|uniref:UDP-galactopyranose mutase n=2 Tax=Sulfobacillus thermosulfidooxidans TaxID=28034 RepID=A0A1W1WHR1_SULTA|nr:NAD(P)/FAD-dependent oxidoreductase [Sulfobacillus thermosulfidooxidans]PSR24918.1 MAG: FAD-dependent oxidoreductase [Sulfobacillus thermosulfidooxidans]SMC05722.1 UDP-galactopyranose mutase [Sulfobacillus thermosulfidooxidans DSM 9293]
MKVVVIGAGPAGLTAAYELALHGIKVVVFEQDPEYVGGISRTVEYANYRFDIGGHRFFSKSQEINNFWVEMLGDDLLKRQRISRIYYNGKFYDYPLRASNAFRNMGLLNTTLCVTDYMKARLSMRKQFLTFEDWVIYHFGRRLYEMFFKTYTEKVWGMKCNEISADWAAQRIKGLNLWNAIKTSVFPNSLKDDEVIKTLINEFYYPKLGPGMLWEKVTKEIKQLGAEVFMGYKVTQIFHKSGLATTVEAKNLDNQVVRLKADKVISTMPLQSLVTALNPAPAFKVIKAAEALRYRDFLTVALIIDSPDLFPDNWIYIHDPSVKVGRIQNFGNWSPYMVPNSHTSCLGLEYFCSEGDSLWMMDNENLLHFAERELRKLGLLQSAKVIDGTVVRVQKAYPVYDDFYENNVQVIVSELARTCTNLQVAGRNGMHRYNNQDHAMMTGLLAARNILGANYDLWAVNGDAIYLEETGEERLVPREINI